jgi:hypothetical protein
MDFALGVVASLVAWAVIAWSLVPRLQVSRPNRYPDPSHPVGQRYRIKLRNTSWFWAVGDLRVDARLVIVGLDANQPRNRTSLVLPVAEGEAFPALESAGLPWRRAPHVDAERTFTFRIAEMRGGGLRRLPKSVRERLGDRSLDDLLEALQQVGHECYFRLAVSATHGLSGVRRTRTVRVRIDDFETGEFETGSVRIVSLSPSITRHMSENQAEASAQAQVSAQAEVLERPPSRASVGGGGGEEEEEDEEE